MPVKVIKSIFCRSLMLCGVLVTAGSSAFAAPFVWNGNGGDGFFQNGLNWVGGIAAPPGSDLFFGQDFGIGLAGLDGGITFNAPTVTFQADASSGFFITAANSSDVLNITGTGTTVVNLSNFRMSTDMTGLTIGGSQTWDGGANGLKISHVDLGNNRILTFTGTGTTAETRNVISVNIDGTGTSGVTKTGSGTLQFDGANTYVGATTVTQGTLELGASDRIADVSNLVMNGGTFNTGGFDESVGKLSLSNFSFIDFGSSNTSDLSFALSSDQNWGAFTITINNFEVGFDTLRFGTDATGLTAGQLANIRFNGTVAAQIDSNGFVTPVPEPGSAALLGLAIAGLVGTYRRSPSRKG